MTEMKPILRGAVMTSTVIKPLPFGKIKFTRKASVVYLELLFILEFKKVAY